LGSSKNANDLYENYKQGSANIMNKKEQDNKTLSSLFDKLKSHYKLHGYGVKKRKKGNPMWGLDPKKRKKINN